MSQMTIRNIPVDQHDALKRVAAANERSTEAEARIAIARHVGVQEGQGFGSKLLEKYSSTIDQGFEFERDQTSSEPVSFK